MQIDDAVLRKFAEGATAEVRSLVAHYPQNDIFNRGPRRQIAGWRTKHVRLISRSIAPAPGRAFANEASITAANRIGTNELDSERFSRA
jgi:hypothetical protein